MRAAGPGCGEAAGAGARAADCSSRAGSAGARTAPASCPGLSLTQLQPRLRRSCSVLRVPRPVLSALRCASLGTETSAHLQVSSGRGSPASPALRRGDGGSGEMTNFLRRRTRLGTSLGRGSVGTAGGLRSDSRSTPLPGQLPAWGEGASAVPMSQPWGGARTGEPSGSQGPPQRGLWKPTLQTGFCGS